MAEPSGVPPSRLVGSTEDCGCSSAAPPQGLPIPDSSSVPSFPARVGEFHNDDALTNDAVNHATKRYSQLRITMSFDSDTDSNHSGGGLPRREALHFETSPPGSEPLGSSRGGARKGHVIRGSATSEDILGHPSADDEEEGDFQILPDDDEAGEDSTMGTRDRKLVLSGRATGSPVPRATVHSPASSPVRSPERTPPVSPQTIRSSPIRRSHRLSAGTAPPSSSMSPRSPGRKSEAATATSSASAAGATTPDMSTSTGAASHRRSSNDDVTFKSPLTGPFRAIRARAMASYKCNIPEPNLAGDEWLQEDGGSSSEESSQPEDSISSDDASGTLGEILEDDYDEDDDDNVETDFAAIRPMPNTFLEMAPDRFDFLDRTLVKKIHEQKLSTFAAEHNLFAKGLMQLLAERDAVGVEDDIHDSSNVIKMGPLKKRTSRGIWSVKYVEIRRGNLSYFADDARGIGSTHRKTIHLRKRTCRCTAVIDETNSHNDIFVFDLVIEGRPKIQFMAKSEEERHGWIRAVRQALIGDVEGSQQNTPVDLSVYQSAIDSYRTVTTALKQVESRGDYLVAVDSLLYRKTASSALRVPMSWLREEVIERREREKDDDSPDARVKSNLAENWRRLSNSTVNINGHLIEQNAPYAANRILGTLARCILEHDRVEAGEDGVPTLKRHSLDAPPEMTELEAASYARSILVCALRSEQHVYIKEAVEHLVQNERVATVECLKSDPLRIDVSFAGEDYMEKEQKPNDVSGWLLTRPKNVRAWKNRYFVVSEGVLSFFAEADPRPYGLRGQLVLNKCTTMKTMDDNILIIEIEEEQRYLQFQDRGQLLRWRAVLERAADSTHFQPPATEREQRRGMIGQIVSTVNPLKSATDTGIKVGKRAMRVMKEAPKAGLKKARGMLANIRQRGQTTPDDDRRNTTEAMLIVSTRGLPKHGDKRDLKVHAVTELNSIFRVMPAASSRGEDPLL